MLDWIKPPRVSERDLAAELERCTLQKASLADEMAELLASDDGAPTQKELREWLSAYDRVNREHKRLTEAFLTAFLTAHAEGGI